MIALDKFLQGVRENAHRITGYQLGHDGSDGTSDCIGLIVGALRLEGEKWPGIHGSNWAARNALNERFIVSADRIFPGEIVFKAYEPWEEKYALPDRYKDSGDALDYYHVGVVTGVDPLEITHCTGVRGGVRRDGQIGRWRYGGKLKYVDYASPARRSAAENGGEGPSERKEETVEKNCEAAVYARNGKPVNMRKGPDLYSAVIARVEVREHVKVLEESGAWAKVAYGGKTGYMMKDFLLTEPEETDAPEGEDVLSVPRETLDTWAYVLEDMARDIREREGQG